MSGARRRSFEAGHRPKFMVVVDESPECLKAVHFAARRCARTGAALVMLSVAQAPESFEWLGVGDALREEAAEGAASIMDVAAEQARGAAGVEPERVIREGDKAEAIIALIEEDQDISFLVLGAAAGTSGPGPLVASVAGKGSPFPIPVVIVPGGLAGEEIDALAG